MCLRSQGLKSSWGALQGTSLKSNPRWSGFGGKGALSWAPGDRHRAWHTADPGSKVWAGFLLLFLQG